MSSSVSNELTSDHFALLCSLDLRIPDPPSIKSSFRNIKCIDRHQLASEINLKLASVVNPTAEIFRYGWICSVSNELTSDHFALLCSLDLRIPDPPPIKASFLL